MKVSVIIPCYNVERYLADCLNSVKNQTYTNLEIICVDDGSTDQSFKILKEFQSDSSFPFKVIQQQNKGASAARNAGLEISSGTYIQFLDADDILKEEKIESQIKLITGSSAAFVVGAFERMNKDGQKTEQFIPDNETSPWIELMRTKLGITSSNLFNRELVEKAGGWDESLKSSQEADLMFRMMKIHDIILYDTTPLTNIQTRESGSISQRDPKGNWQRYAQLREQIFLHVIECNLAPKSEAQAALFDTIHIVYPFDEDLALNLYKTHLKGRYKFNITDILGKPIIILIAFLGFEKAEKIKALLLDKKTKINS
ncbi:glycosyltransferase family 2 protein [Halocola ammonii]